MTPWSAEEMLDGHHQRVDICAIARTAHSRKDWKRISADLSVMFFPVTQSVKRLD